MATRFTRDVIKTTNKNGPGDFNQSHRFSLEIDGVTVGGFNKVDGIDSEHEVTPYQDSDDMRNRVRPGKPKIGRMTVERDWASNTELFDWFMQLYAGNVQRKPVSVVMLADDGGETLRFNFTEAYPTKWSLSNLNSRQSGHVVESVDIMYETVDAA